MKKFSIISLIGVLAILISSCSTSNNVVSNHGISKRKYNKGFFFQRKSNLNSANTKTKDADFKNDNTTAKREKVKADKPLTKREIRNTEVTENEVASVQTENTSAPTVMPREEATLRNRAEVTDHADAPAWKVSETQPTTAGETIDRMPYENRTKSGESKKNNQNNRASDIVFVAAVVFAILLPPLGVAIYTNIDWVKVLIALLLTLLFFLPGMIYALLVVFDVI